MKTRVAVALLLVVLGVNPTAAQTGAPNADGAQADANGSATTASDAAKVDATPHANAPSKLPRFAPWNCGDGSASRTGPDAPGDAGSARDDTVRWSSPREASRTVDRLAPRLEHIRIASPTDFVPSTGPFSVLVFKTFVDRDAVAKDGTPLERLTYRALIVGDPFADCAAASIDGGSLSQVIWPEGVWSERATRGVASAPGTDFKPDEGPQDKTLLHLDANVQQMHGLWRRARIYVIGSAGADGSEPRVIGSIETVVANRTWAALFAILGCIVAYVVAAFATFAVHRMRRVYDDDGNVVGTAARSAARGRVAATGVSGPKIADRFKSSFQNQAAQINKGHGPLDGTNYKTIWTHIFNPVVLTAGSNGLGNATNLQILFFSLIVFGLVTHIWMMTGHLTGLSQTIVLLMGISGIGGTAAAGADLAKNRLSFDNWTWLVNRGWLPPGGIAEVNAAKWKDIFTTNGTFDVYHFQMIWFSVVVGVSLIGVGAQVSDLSTFEVPAALLGILGLSQVVYVTGKLVAPPSISDLDAQIGKLRDAEDALKMLNDAADTTALAGPYVISWPTDTALVQAYDQYFESWQLTRTMFETTVGRLVPEGAAGKRPPFVLTDVILKRLPDAIARQDYRQTLTLAGHQTAIVVARDPVSTGAPPGAQPLGVATTAGPQPAPGTPPIAAASPSFAWKLLPADDGHRYPARMTVTAQGDGTSAVVAFDAAAALPGDYRFAVRIIAPGPGPAIVREFALRIEPAG